MAPSVPRPMWTVGSPLRASVPSIRSSCTSELRCNNSTAAAQVTAAAMSGRRTHEPAANTNAGPRRFPGRRTISPRPRPSHGWPHRADLWMSRSRRADADGSIRVRPRAVGFNMRRLTLAIGYTRPTGQDNAAYIAMWRRLIGVTERAHRTGQVVFPWLPRAVGHAGFGTPQAKRRSLRADDLRALCIAGRNPGVRFSLITGWCRLLLCVAVKTAMIARTVRSRGRGGWHSWVIPGV